MILTKSAWLYIAALIGVVCGALPLLVGRPAALEDWPSHIARVDILTQLQHGNVFWSQFYKVNTFMLPNIAADISIITLHALGLSIATAAQIVLVMTYALFVAGAWALAWALRAADPVKPLLAVVLFYNSALIGGFINYMMGVGVALCLLAAWIAASRPVWRVLIAMCGGIVVFFCHVVAAGFFLFVLGLLELPMLLRARIWTVPNLARHASPLAAAVPVLILFALSPTAGKLSISYSDDPSVLGIVRSKLLLFAHPVLDGSGLLGAAILIIGVAVFAGAMTLALWRGKLVLRLLPAWIILVPGLIALFLIVPNGVGEGLGLGSRLAPLAFLLAALFVRLEWHDRRMQSVCFAILLAVSLARSGSLVRDAAANEAVYRGFAAAASTIPRDSVLLSGIGTPRAAIPWSEFWRPPAEYMGTQAIADNVFVPSVFAFRSQHTLVLRSVFEGWGRQFDVSGPTSLVDTRDVAGKVCAIWRDLGHVGSVYMVVVYPSAYSDHVFPLAARRAAGVGFRIVDVCVMA